MERHGAVGWNPLPAFSHLTPEHGAVWWARNNEPTNDMKLNEIKEAVLVATFRKPCGVVVVDVDTYHGPMAEALEAAEEDAHRYGWELVGVEVASNI
jgi:hypothetical protein